MINFAELFDQGEGNRTFPAGTTIIADGQAARELLVILDGEAEIQIGEISVSTPGRGEILGEMSLIETKPSCAVVRAKTDVVAAPVDENRFRFLIQEHPTFAVGVMRAISDRIRTMDAYAVIA